MRLSPADYDAVIAAARQDAKTDGLHAVLGTVASQLAALDAQDEALPRVLAGLWGDDPCTAERHVISAAREIAQLRFDVLHQDLPFAERYARPYYQDWTVTP